MAEYHEVFRRVDDGQRYLERPSGVAAGDNSASVLGPHGLRSPRGLLVDSCCVLCPLDIRAPREAAVENPRLVHVEDQFDIEPLQLPPNLRDFPLNLRLVHFASFPVQVDVPEAVATKEAM